MWWIFDMCCFLFGSTSPALPNAASDLRLGTAGPNALHGFTELCFNNPCAMRQYIQKVQKKPMQCFSRFLLGWEPTMVVNDSIDKGYNLLAFIRSRTNSRKVRKPLFGPFGALLRRQTPQKPDFSGLCLIKGFWHHGLRNPEHKTGLSRDLYGSL